MHSYRVLVLPDIHVPLEDKRTMAAVEKYMADQQWNEVVYLGDFMDFNCISSHNKENLRAVQGQRIRKDYEAANVMLDRHQALAPLAKFTLIEGNHDERIERYIDANPAVEGMLGVEKG